MESKIAVEPLLEQIVARIVEQAQPEKVILFGSRARGDARSSSDFDILVIKECDESRARREVPLYRALAGLWADVDIIVYTPEEVWEWSAVPQAFVTTAVREGKVLYERKPCVKAKAGSSMKQKADLVRGWLRRARSDLVAMEVLLNAGAFDSACFHAQQAAEKYLKAFLFKASGRYQGLSSAEALRRAAALAAAFDRLGIRRGDRVAILSENRVEWALTDYAVLGMGAALVPIYPTLLEPDIEYIVRDSGSKAIVVSTAAQLNKVLNIRSALPELRFVVVMDTVSATDGSAESWQRLASSELERGQDTVRSLRVRALEVRPEDTASLLYTSGTTGAFKGVVLTHSNIASNVKACERLFPLGGHDVAISFLPLSHVYERMLDYTYFSLGVSIAYAESFDALPQNLLEVRPTVLAVVPRVLEKIHDKVMEAVRRAPAWRRKLFHWAVRVGREYFPYRLERAKPPLGRRIKL